MMNAGANAARKTRIENAGDAARAAWDAYVGAHPDATHFHQFAWSDLVKSVYGYEPVYLIAREGEKVVGVLPLIDAKTPLLGRSLISTAFTVGGGPLADSPKIAAELAGAAVKLGEERDVQYVELRTSGAMFEHWITKADRYAGFRRTITSDDKDNLTAIPRKRRADVRKAIALEESGDLKIEIDSDPARFYALYARASRDLGTPVFARRYIDAMIDTFGDQVEMSTAVFRGAPVASLLSFYFRDVVAPYYIGLGPGAREGRANDALFWGAMRRAAARGSTEFDFGRSKIGTGPYAYKKLWGFEAKPLEYQYWLVKAPEMPDVNPNNPKFAVFTKVWKKMPLPLANAAGPLLMPNFP
ncbi:MAG: FemAB family XrtA/PEP-CTERM system-associated protein [Pseudomonadota bacterium]